MAREGDGIPALSRDTLSCWPKNGKSTLLAALALYMLVADYEGAAEIYSVATKKDQAKKTLTEAVNMVKQSPELSAILKNGATTFIFRRPPPSLRRWLRTRTPSTASILTPLLSTSSTRYATAISMRL